MDNRFGLMFISCDQIFKQKMSQTRNFKRSFQYLFENIHKFTLIYPNYNHSLKYLNNMQQFEKLKEQGNNLFKEKKYKQAQNSFITTVKKIQESNEIYQSSESQPGKLYINLLTNAALCALNLKLPQEYLNAIEYCGKALNIDKNNLKALYRRGLAYKQLGEQQESQQVHSTEDVLQKYRKAEEDLKALVLLDRKNEIADKKLNQTFTNIARIKHLSNLNNNQEKKIKKSTTVQERGPSKISSKMETIMANYKMDEVMKIAEQKTQNSILNSQLPKTKSELEKAVKQLVKKPDLLKLFFLKFNEGYLQKIDPGFDLLFNMVNALVSLKFGSDQMQQFTRLTKQMTSAKSFSLLWKGLMESQRKEIKDKLHPVLSVNPDMASKFV